MRNDSIQLNDILQHEYSKKTGYYTSSELPEKAIFEIDGYKLKVKYPKTYVSAPVEQLTAFEGWMNVCRRWGVFEEIEFDWSVPDDYSGKEYADFIYRVKHFAANFGDYFSISKDAESKINEVGAPGYVTDKRIIESIIDIDYFFETGDKQQVEIPSEWDIELKKGVVEVLQNHLDFGTEPASEADSEVYNPWQLLINRWAYLKTSPKTNQQTLTPWDYMNPVVKNLIKIGFTERNFPFPADY